ncbi:sensor histidine kinase [Mucilaginibacter segetis]|uniref:Histidine kinase n=1 Tax=Mucilaginibacter segetis TaxID=2793071 RepID=A0A934PUW7_9SPHI|nr:histidine kinase [Mucilaginibacter segetis]MBK0381288.1 histidine kinase [Mucilaginibacter segetis]
MEKLIQKPANFNKIEFWTASAFFGLALVMLLTKVANSNIYEVWTPYRYMFNEYGLHYSYSKYYFFPQVARYLLYYGSFLLWNFVIVPGLYEKRNTALNIILACMLFCSIWLFCGITDTWLKGYLFYHKSAGYVYNLVFKTNIIYALWVVMMLTLYSMIKYAANFLLTNSEKIQSNYKIITREGIIAVIIWMVFIYGLLLLDVHIELIVLILVVVPIAIGLYGLSAYTFIPATLNKGKGFFNYWFKVLLSVVIITIPVGFLASFMFGPKDSLIITMAFNAGFQLIVTSTFSWIVYKRRLANNAEINTLKTALGHSTANLDFLRSQINPHFLFNALNTLYGTALQENAERTGEGIQRLGDMMRFMLQENMQDKISLTREIDYLDNYISLQKLRTQASNDIIIDTQIEDHILGLQIAPMLLIPFIENAFKHGISLREPSHIKITLQTKEDTLYFDVHNSIHKKLENDPERDKSGIGLINVRQRLQLLYPKRHELITRENASEFFIHLTIKLSN